VVGVVLLLAALILIGFMVAVAIGSMRSSRRGTSGSLSGAMLEVQSLLEPGKRHAAESVRAEESESDDADDPLESPPR
jgi:hypothetical protein